MTDIDPDEINNISENSNIEIMETKKSECAIKKKKNKNIKTFRDKIIEIENHIENINQQITNCDGHIKKEILQIKEIITKLSNEIEILSSTQKNLIKITNRLCCEISNTRNKIIR